MAYSPQLKTIRMDQFEGIPLGVNDKNGLPLHCGDKVKFIYRDTKQIEASAVKAANDPREIPYQFDEITATIIYKPSLCAFILKWDSHKGYENNYFMNPEKYEKLPGQELEVKQIA